MADAAGHAEKRAKIVQLARGAEHLFIEAAFLECDRALAQATRNLTAGAAGEIARAAEVKHVSSFHHSARHLADPDALSRETFQAFEPQALAGETKGR